MLLDLEHPGELLRVAHSLATPHNELLLMATGPDATSIQMAKNALVSLNGIGLRQHVLMLADTWTTCAALHDLPCYWSSRVLRRQPVERLEPADFRVGHPCDAALRRRSPLAADG